MVARLEFELELMGVKLEFELELMARRCAKQPWWWNCLASRPHPHKEDHFDVACRQMLLQMVKVDVWCLYWHVVLTLLMDVDCWASLLVPGIVV